MLSHVDMRLLWVDVTSVMSKVQMMNISINFPLYTFAKSPPIHMRQLCLCKVRFTKSPHVHTRQLCHLASTQNGNVVSYGCKVTLGRCYLGNVQSANDEYFHKFSLIYFCKVTLHPRKTTLPPHPCEVRFTKSHPHEMPKFPRMDAR